MRNLAGVGILSFVGAALALGGSVTSQAQANKFTVHPASTAQVITVTVTDLVRTKKGKDAEVVIAQAAGFPNDTCDVITTFDVVKMYEERQTWSNVRERVDIVVNGTKYPAKFRDIGFYPLGLNLACVDFESPYLHSELKIPVLPLEDDSDTVPGLAYDDKELASSHPGTPFLNKAGEISSVLTGTNQGKLEFASAEEIRAFLKLAADVSPWPSLYRRPLAAT
ncbi:hypothetical protein DYQ86_17365 [Acidobacteria bacterium AB60]|nr:hypothetical protein DYQ86_17365 [Acidobacteria bacterium AB60]